MKIQYGQLLTLIALAVTVRGSSVEDVLSQLSASRLEDMFNDLSLQEFQEPRDTEGFSPKNYPSYDYDYDNMFKEDVTRDASESLTEVDQAQPEAGQGNKIHANNMLPAYCDPPNPCPIGYTTSDGCIENFENTSEFSRRFQATQKCICDTEHMFDCPEEEVHRGPEDIAAVNMLAGIPGLVDSNDDDDNNPYLDGQKLPVVSKKGIF